MSEQTMSVTDLQDVEQLLAELSEVADEHQAAPLERARWHVMGALAAGETGATATEVPLDAASARHLADRTRHLARDLQADVATLRRGLDEVVRLIAGGATEPYPDVALELLSTIATAANLGSQVEGLAALAAAEAN